MSVHSSRVTLIGIVAALASSPAFALDLKGSDTLAGVMTDAIVAAGLDGELSYAGGGSGNGEAALVAGEQGIAPMSRKIKDEAKAKAAAAGVTVVEHAIGLDGVEVLVNKANPITQIDVLALKNIFSCLATKWEEVPNSGRTGTIKVYRRNDASGTTDTFKSLVKIDTFGDCVKVMPETADIAQATATDPDAIGYSGLSARRPNNKPLNLSKGPGQPYFAPTVQNIRSFDYPLARTLYVYAAQGASGAEAKLLEKVLDRAFIDPILQANEFFTLD